jgi:hypothetical protein
MRLTDAFNEWTLGYLSLNRPGPPHFCGRCGVLVLGAGAYIMHRCDGPTDECLSAIGREPLGMVWPLLGPGIVTITID